MKHQVHLRNRQRAVRINLRPLRTIARDFTAQLFPDHECELGICLVSSLEMEQINSTFCSHDGSTDVITFNYSDPSTPASLVGEIFICPEVAASQSKTYRTTLSEELARYLIHGLLHLQGYEDDTVPARRRMKRRENQLLKQFRARLPLVSLVAGSRCE